MKMKKTLLSIITPAIVVGSVATIVVPLSLSKNSQKKDDKKQKTRQIKMSKVSNLKDINATDAPFCILNTDLWHPCSIVINYPKATTTVKLFSQTGVLNPDTNEINWNGEWTQIAESKTIENITYHTPIRFYAYNSESNGQFNTQDYWENNFNFMFESTSSKAQTEAKGIRLAGSLRSLLGTKAIEGEEVTTVDDLGENSHNVFNSLFYYEGGSSNLFEVSPGFLPFTTMKDNCYKNMFSGNAHLLSAPDLPAKVLYNNCYSGMFEGCSSLQNAPHLPATVLAENCYGRIFAGCTNLTSISLAYAGTLYEDFFGRWLDSAGAACAQPVIFYDGFDVDYSKERLESNVPSYIPSYFKIVSKTTTDSVWLNANTTVFEFKDDKDFGTPTVKILDYYPSKFRAYNTDPVSVIEGQYPKIEQLVTGKFTGRDLYKKNASNEAEYIDVDRVWEQQIKTSLPTTLYIRCMEKKDVEEAEYVNIVAQEDSTITLNKKATEAKIYYKDRESGEDKEFDTSDSNAITLKKDQILKIYGDIKSTGNRDNQTFTVDNTQFKITGKVTLKGSAMLLLSENKGTAATALKDYCFAGLFEGSTASITIDSSFMPATSVALKPGCFYQMFKGCTGLTTPPTLGWTTLADSCYCGMFSGCTNLTLPSGFTLPATTATDYCYQAMFYGCESITTPVDIPFSQMKYWCCESMYMGCKNLTRPAIFNNGNQITEDDTETYKGYSLNNCFKNCSKIKVCTDAQKSQVSNPKIFFWCWDYNPGTGWGTGPEGTFRGTNGKYKYPTGGGGGPGGGQPVDPQSGIANTKYYYYS